jgi:hypothetical protein
VFNIIFLCSFASEHFVLFDSRMSLWPIDREDKRSSHFGSVLMLLQLHVTNQLYFLESFACALRSGRRKDSVLAGGLARVSVCSVAIMLS